MRKFGNDEFNFRLAQAINSLQLEVPDEESEEALRYIKQFVYKTSSRSKLLEGYIDEDYLDALVRIRDNSSVRDFGSAVEALGCGSDSSREVDKYDEFKRIRIKSTREQSSLLREEYYSADDEDTRNEIGNLENLMQNNFNRDNIVYFMPTEIYDKIDWSSIKKSK